MPLNKNYFDSVKLKLYTDMLYHAYVYDSPESTLDKQITETIVKEIIDPLELNLNSKILDYGSGQGYFLDELKNRKFNTYLGITLSENDRKNCIKKNHPILLSDVNFLSLSDGFYDNSVEFIFNRCVLQDSPFPLFSLYECNRLLIKNGLMYIEIPDFRSGVLSTVNYIDNDGLIKLLELTGFDFLKSKTISIDVDSNKINFFGYLVYKKFDLDIK